MVLSSSVLSLTPNTFVPASPMYQTNPWIPVSAPNLGAPGTTGTVLNSLGVPVPAPEQGLDPAELAANIETSLAKLDTVNPELANEMRAKYLGQDVKDTGGLLGVLKDIGGSLLQGFGAILDVVARTSHIVPAMFVHDDDPWYTDMAQALSGQDRSTWNDVFQDWDWNGEGLSGKLRATLGFVGDVATDPLTYAFGAGAMAQAGEKASIAAKAGFTAVLKEASLAERGAAIGLTGVEKAAEVSELLWTSMKGQGDSLRTMLRGLSPEKAGIELAGRAGYEVASGASKVMADAWWAAGRNYERVYGRTFKSFLRGGELDTLPSGLKISGAETQNILEGYIKLGNWANPRSIAGEVAQAKGAASALGGLRFTPFIPWTTLRYFSPTLPFTMGTLTRPLNVVARFAAGKSVIVRAERLVQNLGFESAAGLSLLHQGGIQALKDSTDPAARLLYDGLAEGGIMRSAFYRASEQTGKLTASFTPGARMFRMGLGYYFEESALRGARSTISNIIKNTLYEPAAKGVTGARREMGYGQQKLYVGLEKLFGVSNRIQHMTATDETCLDVMRYLDHFGGLQTDIPISTAQVKAGELDKWFWSRSDVAGRLADSTATEEGFEISKEALEAQLASMKRLLTVFPEGSEQRNLLIQMSAVWTRGNDYIGSYGWHSRDIGYSQLGEQRVISRADKYIAQAGTEPGIAAKTWWGTFKGSEGATADDVTGNGELGVACILLHEKPVEGAVEVAVDLRSPLVLGQGGQDEAGRLVTDILTDQPALARAHQEAENGMRNTLQALVAEKKDPLPNSVYSPERWDETAAEITSTLLNRSGGLNNDSIYIRNAVHGDSIAVLGTPQIKPQDLVWAIDDTAARITRTHGYAPRIMTRQAREFVGGAYGAGRRKIVRSVPDVEAVLNRSTIDKTFDEADLTMRAELARLMREDQVPETVVKELFVRDDAGNYLMRLLEINPLKVHEHYVERVSSAAWAGLMGRQANRINALGRLVPSMFGRTTHIEQARCIVDTSAYSLVKKAGKDVEKSVAKFLQRERVYLDGQWEDSANASERIAELLRRWELGEDVDLTDIPALNPHTQRLLRTSDNFQVALGREQTRLIAEKDVWTRRAEDTAKAEELIRGDVEKALKPKTVYTHEVSFESLEQYEARGGHLEKKVIPEIAEEPMSVIDVQGELERMMNSGTLGIHADGTVVTRGGVPRQAGRGAARRVFSRQEVDQALQRVTDRIAELEQIAANPYIIGRSETGGLVSRLTPLEELAAQEDFAAWLKAGGKVPVIRRTSIEVSAAEVVKARKALGTAVTREAKTQGVEMAKEAARKSRLGRDLQEAMGSMNDMRDVYENAQAKLRPAVVSTPQRGGRAFMTEVDVPGLRGTWWHPYMAQELELQLHGKPLTHMRNMWREFVLNPWKKWATYRNPGFHVRNFMGGWFNNFLGGCTTQDYHFANRLMSARDGGKWANKLMTKEEFRGLGLNLTPGIRDLEGQLTYGDMANMLSDVGITRGSAAAVELVEGGVRERQRLTAQAARPARWADQHLRRFSSTVEDYLRVAAWCRGMKTTPGDLYGARAFVMMRQGDYGDLTESEDFIRDLVPFYKWSRTNIPYQIRMLMQNPGYMTGVLKLQKSIFDVSGLDAQEYIKATPDWMRGTVSFPLPGQRGNDEPLNMLSFDLPFMDLYKGTREYVSSFLPVVLPIIESLVFKQQVFSGRSLTGKMIPLAGWAQLPGIKQAIAALPFAQMGPDGQVYMPDTMENILTGIPIYGRFRNWLTGDPDRVEKRWGALTSFMLGIPIRQIDLNADEMAFYYDVLQPTLDSYKSMGVVFPTKDQLVDAGYMFQQPTVDVNTLYPDGVVGQTT